MITFRDVDKDNFQYASAWRFMRIEMLYRATFLDC